MSDLVTPATPLLGSALPATPISRVLVSAMSPLVLLAQPLEIISTTRNPTKRRAYPRFRGKVVHVSTITYSVALESAHLRVKHFLRLGMARREALRNRFAADLFMLPPGLEKKHPEELKASDWSSSPKPSSSSKSSSSLVSLSSSRQKKNGCRRVVWSPRIQCSNTCSVASRDSQHPHR